MPNATFAPDVSLHTVAALARRGWTFRANRAGVFVRSPNVTVQYCGYHVVEREHIWNVVRMCLKGFGKARQATFRRSAAARDGRGR